MLKWAFASASLAVGVLLVGCQPSTGVKSAEGGGVAPEKLTIGVSIPSATHGWTAGVNWWAQETAKLYPNVEWKIQAAATPAEQISQIETLMTGGLDGLVVLATESAPLTPVAKKVKDAGIYLVSVDRGFTEPVADLFLEGNNVDFGRISAEYMVQKLGGQGSIIILRGIPSTVDTDRYEAAMKVFAANPGIKVLDTAVGRWNRQEALNQMQTLLTKHPKIDAIWASDDDMALGVEQALREANRLDGVWILGGAGMKDVIQRVMDKDPLFPANVTYPPSMIATGMHLALSQLRDGKKAEIEKFMPRHMLINVELVTPDNAKDHYFPDSVY